VTATTNIPTHIPDSAIGAETTEMKAKDPKALFQKIEI
jgi:hypothetical protein